MNRIQFLTGLIGKPYSPGATGPEAFDCLGLASYVLHELFGQELPKSGPEMIAARRLWVQAKHPHDGSIVIMRDGDKHVGVWLTENSGGVLHATNRRGVVFDSTLGLSKGGFGVPRFFNRRVDGGENLSAHSRTRSPSI